MFLLIVWLPNLGLIARVVTSDMSAGEKAVFLWGSAGAISTTFTTLGAWLTGSVALLFGLNVAVTIHYLRQRAIEARAGGAALGGVVVALIGAGCSSCGAIVLSTIVGAGAAGSFVGGLPLRGDEFGIVSVLILAATLVLTARRASRPITCSVRQGPDLRLNPTSTPTVETSGGDDRGHRRFANERRTRWDRGPGSLVGIATTFSRASGVVMDEVAETFFAKACVIAREQDEVVPRDVDRL